MTPCRTAAVCLLSRSSGLALRTINHAVTDSLVTQKAAYRGTLTAQALRG